MYIVAKMTIVIGTLLIAFLWLSVGRMGSHYLYKHFKFFKHKSNLLCTEGVKAYTVCILIKFSTCGLPPATSLPTFSVMMI